MNPVIVIPTYVGEVQKFPNFHVVATYDHSTPLNHQGELNRCLASICDRGITAPVFILVVSEEGYEREAAAKVRETVAMFDQDLQITVIDDEMLGIFYLRAEALGFSTLRDTIGLTGYGAIRNLGFVAAAVGGYTECIFIDDDEVIEDDFFMEKALYGLGKLTPKGVPILVKTGFFLDSKGSWRSPEKKKWYDRYWQQGLLFNEWITSAMRGIRLSRSNTLYGGLCAIHREAFRRIAFDPWIPRGEDLDYLLNVRMYGGDVWFDNRWLIRHLPPVNRNESQRFRQDIFRWIYEQRKLEYAHSQIDLIPIQPNTLDPYPGPFLERSISMRVFLTAILRSIGRPRDRRGYYRAAMAARREGKAYAESFCMRYYEFQRGWPQLISVFESDPLTRTLLTGAPLSASTGSTDSTSSAASVASAALEELEELETTFPDEQPYTTAQDTYRREKASRFIRSLNPRTQGTHSRGAHSRSAHPQDAYPQGAHSRDDYSED